VQPAIRRLAEFLGGFTAAEGSFIRGARRFRFAIGLGAIDRETCELFRDFLGVGNVYFYPRRKPHYDDEVTYVVQASADLATVVVPFMDEHLPPSYKRMQYFEWKSELLDYVENHARRKGRAPCTVEGCGQPARAHGLCRPHLWKFRRE
jgi:hypothetical protein